MTTFIQLPASGGGADFISSILDGDSIDLEVLANQLTAELFHSANAAAANQVKITNTTETDGLLSVLPYSDSNSINFSGSTSLSADLNLSAEAAPGGNFKATNTIESDGLLTVIPEAATGQTGVLTSTDWNTFNDGVTPITDGSFPGAGEIGQVITDTQALTTGGPVSGSFGQVCNVSLTAGIWLIDGMALLNDSGANITAPFETGIDTTQTGANLTAFDTVVVPYTQNESSVTRSVVLLPSYVSISASDIYYLVTKTTFDTGTPQVGGFLRARRVR